MKAIIFLFCLVSALSSSSFSAKHTVTNSGFIFSPDTITIHLGDTVIFSLASIHTAREVSQATWNVNGNTSDGGFDTPLGGGTVIPAHTGTYYYVCAIHYSIGMKGTITVVSPTEVRDPRQTIPSEYSLIQNYPNPFNPSTSINYELPAESKVMVKIINVQGQIVATLVDQVQPAGYQSVEWNAAVVASGIYFYRLEATSIADPSRIFIQTRKMVLMK